MKKHLFLFSILFLTTSLLAQNNPNLAVSCTSILNIPDANFKTALLDHGVGITGTGISVIDANRDGEICTDEASAYTGTINVENKNINDLTGIEAFTALTVLKCGYNSLRNLDISANTALINLFCYNNNLIYLNVANGNNQNMVNVKASNNPNLPCIQHDTGFNPANNSNWRKPVKASWSDNCGPPCTSIVNIPDANFKAALLDHGVGIKGDGEALIDTNRDGEICITEAQAYTGLISVYSKNISDLTGIEAFTSLTKLWCGYNSLTNIDVSNNTSLISLACSNNSLTSIDISKNTVLTEFICNNNQPLTSLNLANGNNATKLKNVEAHSNPNLTCIQHDSGFTPPAWDSRRSKGWKKDTTASWSDNCTAASINDITFSNFITLHPNPVNSNLYIDIKNTQISTIEIYNVLGKKVLNTTKQTIDVSNFSKGIFFIKIQSTEGKTAIKKLLKN